jgi:hypothetical protein
LKGVPGLPRARASFFRLAGIVILAAKPAFSQTPAAAALPALGSVFQADVVNDLPAGGSLFSILESATDHMYLLAGATAARAVGPAGNRGFQANENDQGILGELYTDPNAATNARGRLFNDRAYTIKLAGIYRFPKEIRLSVIARYQDGQPFARLVIVPGLAQGAEAIRAFPNGDSRFAYTLTVDARLQKGFAIGGHRIVAMLDAFNLLNQSNEVEELTLTGPSYRIPTAVQPPRTLRAGLRITF